MADNFKLPYKIKEKYSIELNNIAERLSNMEKGRIYGSNGNLEKGDGALQYNCDKLRKDISSLLSKIQNGSDSIEDKLDDIF